MRLAWAWHDQMTAPGHKDSSNLQVKAYNPCKRRMLSASACRSACGQLQVSFEKRSRYTPCKLTNPVLSTVYKTKGEFDERGDMWSKYGSCIDPQPRG